MHQSSGSTTPQQRVAIRTAVREISDRLRTVRRQLGELRYDTIGPCEEGAETPEPLVQNNLEADIFALYPVLCDIENDVARLIDRVGVDVNKPTVKAVVGR